MRWDRMHTETHSNLYFMHAYLCVVYGCLSRATICLFVFASVQLSALCSIQFSFILVSDRNHCSHSLIHSIPVCESTSLYLSAACYISRCIWFGAFTPIRLASKNYCYYYHSFHCALIVLSFAIRIRYEMAGKSKHRRLSLFFHSKIVYKC